MAKTNIETSAQAGEALRPLAGVFAETIFALGIIGTGLLAIPVIGTALARQVRRQRGRLCTVARLLGVQLLGSAARTGSVFPGALLLERSHVSLHGRNRQKPSPLDKAHKSVAACKIALDLQIVPARSMPHVAN